MTSGTASLRIAVDHPALAGHFPGNPIVPGVVLLDEVLYAIQSQQAAVFGMASWRIDVVKFHRAVLPAQALQLEYQSQRGGLFPFELRAADGLVVSGTLIVGDITGAGLQPPAAAAETLP